MRLPKPRHTLRLRRDAARPVAPPAAEPAAVDPAAVAPARDPQDEHAPAETAEAGFRASSYDLKRGLDVVELPTSLPADVLDRLFKSPRR
jgi:hypothetical protein